MYFLQGPYFPKHEDNLMSSEGDTARARKHYFAAPRSNTAFLIKQRYSWMNAFIQPTAIGIDVGTGAGLSKEFIKAASFRTTDLADYPWLDVKSVDALHTPFSANEFDFVISSNMIHHVAHPVVFFEEMNRILKPGGVLIIQEINASFFMRLLLRIMRHEGFSFEPNVFDRTLACNDPADAWSANCAIPNLLFDDLREFEKEIPYFAVEHHAFTEFFTFINSGGVTAKTISIPLPLPVLHMLNAIDNVLARSFPRIFALQRQIVLRKR